MPETFRKGRSHTGPRRLMKVTGSDWDLARQWDLDHKRKLEDKLDEELKWSKLHAT